MASVHGVLYQPLAILKRYGLPVLVNNGQLRISVTCIEHLAPEMYPAFLDVGSTCHWSPQSSSVRLQAPKRSEGYITRPPLALERLSQRSDGRLELELKSVWKDGTRAILLEPHDLLVRLCASVPAPHLHLVRYFGVLSSHVSFASTTVTSSHASCVPSTAVSSVVLEVSWRPALGHVGGGTFA